MARKKETDTTESGSEPAKKKTTRRTKKTDSPAAEAKSTAKTTKRASSPRTKTSRAKKSADTKAPEVEATAPAVEVEPVDTDSDENESAPTESKAKSTRKTTGKKSASTAKKTSKPSARSTTRKSTTSKSSPKSTAKSSAAKAEASSPAKSTTPATSTPVQSPPVDSQGRRWFKADMHLHTMGSSDYEEPKASYLDWMRRVAEQGLDIVAITDHNTAAGIGAMRREVEWLLRLESEGRLTKDESKLLDEWRILTERTLILPGFEFTATFGFHILGIFPPETTVRQLEHILLQLNVPAEKLDEGSTETGASTDVLTAYKVIHEAGGLAIAAHANSSHGVAMRDFPFGGQTKIAYTQDPNLDALEVTDLEKKRGRTTARFFNGTKNEYPRRMHCIQGSDAHRLTAKGKRLGIGDRCTDLLLKEATFDALVELFRSDEFNRTRPARPKDEPFDPVEAAREEGPGIALTFHESASQRGGRLAAVLSDVCALANTVGGTIYIGASQGKPKPKGLAKPEEVKQEIQDGLEERITPPLAVKIEVQQSQGASVLALTVPKGPERPYCLDEFKFYIRDETDTNMAVRDEIVALVREVIESERRQSNQRRSGGNQQGSSSNRNNSGGSGSNDRSSSNNGSGGRNRRGRGRGRGQDNRNQDNRNQDSRNQDNRSSNSGSSSSGQNQQGRSQSQHRNNASRGQTDVNDAFYLPQIGVEIIESTDRKNPSHSIRDMRNGNVIKNVTRKGSRKLWNYAIQQHEDRTLDTNKVDWQGDIGLVHVDRRAGKVRYDLALRENDNVRVFYGVTEEGMEGRWSVFIQDEDSD